VGRVSNLCAALKGFYLAGKNPAPEIADLRGHVIWRAALYFDICFRILSMFAAVDRFRDSRKQKREKWFQDAACTG